MVHSFRKVVYILKKIAIYGLSIETERVLPTLKKEYEILCLLDSFKNTGEMFTYPIFSIYQAIEAGVEKIIVVARPGSCKAITKNIEAICKDNNIELFDIRGNDLLAEKEAVYDLCNLIGYKKSELISQIKLADVVSFDFFDTLVMRNIPSFNDFIELLNVRLIENGIVISDFVNKRIAAEKELSRSCVPRLAEIYTKIVEKEKNMIFSAEYLADIEFNLDVSLLQVRAEVVELVSLSKQLGKKVCVTSDSYYSGVQFEHLILSNSIDNIDDMLISCEYGIDKTGGLFEILAEKSGTKNILHIGDDILADIESANNCGLKSFKIYSAVEIFDAVGGLGLLSDKLSISDKIKIGMFIAIIFNSPFQFESESRKICVQKAEDVAYLFCAPMVVDFVQWFGQQVKNKGIKNIWFGARDGYLIQKIFTLFYTHVKTEYFLTSRIAAIRAGMKTITDIEYVDSMKFSGTVRENLKTRFGIENVSEKGENLCQYADVILKNTKLKCKNYVKYIEQFGNIEGSIAFFDFVAKGTTQFYLQRLVKNHIMGLYFLRLESHVLDLDVLSFYTDDERETSAIFDNYYILEILLTSPEPSVEEFDVLGQPIFSEETRFAQDIDCVMRMQEAVVRYFKKYLEICPRTEVKVNKIQDEIFLKLLSKVTILDNTFFNLVTEDQFFNRFTKVTDVI